MRRRARVGLLASVLALAIGEGVAGATVQFPPSIYPPPVPLIGTGAAFSSCPNPAGLERFDLASTTLARQVASVYGRVSLTADLEHSDRSWWQHLRHHPWQRFSFPVVRGSQLGGPKRFWSGVVRHYCGSKLLADSLSVDVTGRKIENCDCNGVSMLFIDRRGRPLVYMVH